MANKNLTIRNYRKDDIKYMVERASEIVPALPHYRGINVSKPRLEFLLTQNMNPQSGFSGWVLTDNEDIPRGFGAGYCVPAIFSTELIANDVFLFVEPEWRSIKNVDLLISTYVTWAKTKGAKLIRASETGGLVAADQKGQEVYDKLLSRHKFVRFGSVYYVVD